MASFSIMGKLIVTFSLFSLNPSQEICSGALEALYYLLSILVLQRSKYLVRGWPLSAGSTDSVIPCIVSGLP